MSKKRRNFAWAIHKCFQKADKKIYAVHPEGGKKNGVSFYKNIAEIPLKPEACIICADLKKSSSLISELAGYGIKKIWLQQGSYDKNTLAMAAKGSLDPLTGCVLMYLPGVSFGHRLHRFFHELFSKGKD